MNPSQTNVTPQTNVTSRTSARVQRMLNRPSRMPTFDLSKTNTVVTSRDLLRPSPALSPALSKSLGNFKIELFNPKLDSFEELREQEYIEEMRCSLSQNDFEDWYAHHLGYGDDNDSETDSQEEEDEY